jgi:uncharacterized C2H2 Zn-finger protein
MTNLSWIVVLASFGGVLLSCAHQKVPEYVVFDSKAADDQSLVAPKNQTITQKNSIEEKLSRLESILKNHPEEKSAVEDIKLMFMAQSGASQNMQNKDVERLWRNAAEKGRGAVGKVIFTEWLKSFARTRPKDYDEKQFAKDILEVTKNGRLLPYMVEAKLTTSGSLLRFVRIVGVSVKVQKEQNRIILENFIAELPRGKFSVEDPFLEDLQAHYCTQFSQKEKKRVAKWGLSLKGLKKSYWKVLKQDCGEDIEGATARYNKIIPKLLTHKKLASLAIYASTRLISLYRQVGDRENIAAAYIHLVNGWELNGTAPLKKGQSADELKLRRINEFLWASRCLALVGQHDEAERLVNKAQTYLKQLRRRAKRMKHSKVKLVRQYEAEAAHILSWRIYLERKEYAQAYAVSKKALDEKKLTKAWRQRFLWCLGLYALLDDKKALAFQVWSDFLKKTETDSYRERLLFWLARLSHQSQKTAQAAAYLAKLKNEYPTGFYVVVGIKAAGLPDDNKWRDYFESYDGLVANFNGRRRYDLKYLRRNGKGALYLRRAEIISGIGSPEIERLLVRELERHVRKTYVPSSSLDAFIYTSRLLEKSENYFRAIWLCTDLVREVPSLWQKYPDQLLTMFPRPYLKWYAAAAKPLSGVDAALLLAFSRQESAFRIGVKSPAGAVGLMQLMPNTAKRTARSSGDESLDFLKPQENIIISGYYLRELSRRYHSFLPAVMAAYNAGEYAVDSWRKRRHHPDPLVWGELIPFKETNRYVKNVWRNYEIYRFFDGLGPSVEEALSVSEK